MSPPVLVDKYTGRKSERYLMDIIGRVAREFAPSIIFIDNGEKPWLKTVPPQDRYFKPKRFAKHFSKMVKSIKRGDQVILHKIICTGCGCYTNVTIQFPHFYRSSFVRLEKRKKIVTRCRNRTDLHRVSRLNWRGMLKLVIW